MDVNMESSNGVDDVLDITDGKGKSNNSIFSGQFPVQFKKHFSRFQGMFLILVQFF